MLRNSSVAVPLVGATFNNVSHKEPLKLKIKIKPA